MQDTGPFCGVYLIMVGRFACHKDPEGYAVWRFILLVGSTLADRRMDSGQTK